MPRLPIPGKDNGAWGDILNEYLSQTHKSDGSLKDNVVTTNTIQRGTITEDRLDTATRDKLNIVGSGNIADDTIATAKLQDAAVTSAKIADGTIINTDISPAAAIAKSKLAPLNIADADVAAGAAIVQSKIANLTADLAAKASTSDLTSGLAGKADTSHTHTAADITAGTVATARLGSGTADGTTFLRGDGTWATPVGSDDPLNSNGVYWHSFACMADTTGLVASQNLPTTSLSGRSLAWYRDVFYGENGAQQGFYCAPGVNGAAYCTQTLPGNVKWGRMDFCFADIGSTQRHAACIAVSNAALSDETAPTIDMAIHFLATRSTWAMTMWSDFSLIPLVDGPLSLPSDVSKTYSLSFQILDANTVIFMTPDGVVRKAVDPQGRFDTYSGPYMVAESYTAAATDGIVLVKHFEGGTGQPPAGLFKL